MWVGGREPDCVLVQLLTKLHDPGPVSAFAFSAIPVEDVRLQRSSFFEVVWVLRVKVCV